MPTLYGVGLSPEASLPHPDFLLEIECVAEA